MSESQEILEKDAQKIDSNADKSEKSTENSEQLPDEINWKAFREARKKEREEKEAALRRAAEKEREIEALKAAMEAAFSKSAPTPEAYNQYYGQDNENSEDQLIEKKIQALLEKKEQQYRQEQAEKERREYPSRLVSTYPDFRQVCSQENLDYLDYHYPEISRPLQKLPEGFEKWEDIYRAVKKLLPNTQANRDAKKAEENSMKPKSISSVNLSKSGDKPMESWKEVEARRAANWERMQRTLKGL